ncbi:MAG TPA: DUF4126 domain-containing protein [Myxococcota bacterium]|jgi:hypothetical protein
MTPDLLAHLGIAAGAATGSGLRVYGTVAALGWLQRYGVLDLPGPLEVLGATPVVLLASALYVAEFVADKVPAFDSVWDAVHTFVRVPAAALLAFAALGDAPEAWRASASLLAGGVALSVHGLKSGARLAVNASPEPFSNWGLSLAEEISFAGIVYLVIAHPVASIAVAGVLLLAGIALMFWIARTIRRLFRGSPPGSPAASA